jgi:hypothetical protein
MRTYLFLSLAAVLLATGCKKDDPEAGLPTATQEGKNTFGCLVDGQVFVPKPGQAISITKREPLEASVYRTDLLVSGMGDGYVEFALHNASQQGTYALGETSTKSYGTYSVSGIRYYTNTAHVGTVTITRIDTVAKVAAGTFQFTALDYQSGKTVTISNGRFDVRLH